MKLSLLEKALLPYEVKLRSQEKLRQRLGVKEVNRPTYERYITGPIERFDRHNHVFWLVRRGNPLGEEFRQRLEERGIPVQGSLPYSELDMEDRIGRSLSQAAGRLCTDYNPEPLPVTPPEGRTEIADVVKVSRLIKKAALFFGADMVRITEIDPRWVYKDIDISHRYAIICVFKHSPSFISTAPSHFSSIAGAEAYSRLKHITAQLSDFICGLGYEAMYRETRVPGDELMMVPLALDAGVGEFARNGRVLSPEFGINMRLKAVTTDMPLKVDKPISFGVHDFCMVCESCAEYCPANAIPYGPPTDNPINIYNNQGLRKWYLNAERCYIFSRLGKKRWSNCTRCIHVCPWNKPTSPGHNFVRYMAIHSPSWIKNMLVQSDKIAYKRNKSIKQQ